MGTFSVWHWLIVLAVVLILFGGGGKIPKLMKDMGSGINAFKKGLKEEEKNKDDSSEEEAPKALEGETSTAKSTGTSGAETGAGGSETASTSSTAESQEKDRKAANG